MDLRKSEEILGENPYDDQAGKIIFSCLLFVRGEGDGRANPSTSERARFLLIGNGIHR